MPRGDAILTAAQMRAAEQLLIERGVSVDELMQRAGRGAADLVWRISGGRAVSVLCGPGNNGGDGYVIAEAIRRRGGDVAVVAPVPPSTDAAGKARAVFAGPVLEVGDGRRGEVFVDCLFGTGLTRPLAAEHLAQLQALARDHHLCVAVDLPSGVDSDRGLELNRGLPAYDLTIALGAWKFAHFLMPAAAKMGQMRLVPIGIEAVAGAGRRVAPPRLSAPAADAHKYRRGLLGIVGGIMPGAAILAARAAQGAGAGYVKLLADQVPGSPPDLVLDQTALAGALADSRFNAVLVGPGLGRDGPARERLELALSAPVPAVVDADALVLLVPPLLVDRPAPVIATPHEGELEALERAFDLANGGSKVERAAELARQSGMIVVAKGADTVVAAPDGRIACASRASSWLSTAGTGDVLAGTIASRMAVGCEPFEAACQGLWLHGEAARRCPPAFTAGQLALAVRDAYAACL